MKLHENEKLFKEAVTITSQRMNIPPEFVEKDYWVTFALYVIFNDEIGADVIFKGGTSLSKCYKIIERFSEDIDLTVIRHPGESNSKLDKKIRQISIVLAKQLPEIEIAGLTNKMGMNRKTAHTYKIVFNNKYDQIRNVIVLEASWLGYFEPYENKSVQSYIAEMMESQSQHDIIDEYGLMSFEVKVLKPTRTLCEKIMSLVRFSYSEDPLIELKRKIRHIYDIHQLINYNDLNKFVQSENFGEMLKKVAEDDILSYKNTNNWLLNHPKEAIIFKELDNKWSQLSGTYNGEFKDLVYGALPDSNSVYKSMKFIQERLEKVNWTVQL